MQSKLTPDEIEVRDHLDRWISHKLVDDPESPWHGMIHLGGSKVGSRVQGLKRPLNFASLQGGVMRTLRKSQYIHDLTDPEAQYVLVRNYWRAVKQVFSLEWGNQKDYLLLKNIGVCQGTGPRRDRGRDGEGALRGVRQQSDARSAEATARGRRRGAHGEHRLTRPSENGAPALGAGAPLSPGPDQSSIAAGRGTIQGGQVERSDGDRDGQ